MRIVYYDLETTGVSHADKHKNVQLLQIGAVDADDGKEFEQYILPTCEIDSDATKVHGLSVAKEGLLLRGKKVDAVEMKLGLERFLKWLEDFGEPVVLVGYNSSKFDNYVLCHNLLRCRLTPAKGILEKFGDGLNYIAPVLRQWGVSKGAQPKLSMAVKKLVKREQKIPHSALDDAKDLKDVSIEIAKIKQSKVIDLLCDHLKDVKSVWKVCLPMEREHQIASHDLSDSDSD